MSNLKDFRIKHQYKNKNTKKNVKRNSNKNTIKYIRTIVKTLHTVYLFLNGLTNVIKIKRLL